MIDGLEKQHGPSGCPVEVPGTLGKMTMLQLGQLSAFVDQLAILKLAGDEFIAVEHDGLVLFRDLLKRCHGYFSVIAEPSGLANTRRRSRSRRGSVVPLARPGAAGRIPQPEVASARSSTG